MAHQIVLKHMLKVATGPRILYIYRGPHSDMRKDPGYQSLSALLGTYGFTAYTLDGKTLEITGRDLNSARERVKKHEFSKHLTSELGLVPDQLSLISQKLSGHVQRDQRERNEYLKGYLQPLGYAAGIKKWLKDKNRKLGDVFDDRRHVPEIQSLVSELVESDQPLPQQVLEDAWLLVQHMDEDRPFQKKFLEFLKKHHPGTSQFKYLSDRISMAETGTQEYGTQNAL